MAKKKFPDLTGDGKVTKADDSVDTVGNPKGKKKPIQIAGWGKARH